MNRTAKFVVIGAFVGVMFVFICSLLYTLLGLLGIVVVFVTCVFALIGMILAEELV